MAADDIILFTGRREGWRAFRAGDDDGAQPLDVPAAENGDAESGEAAGAALRQWCGSRRGFAAVVALGSSQCLCASIDVADLPQRGRRAMMVYRLEEKLPHAAEDVAADFLVSAAGDAAMGVAATTAELSEIGSPLAQAGVNVAAVCPAALLALDGAPVEPDVDLLLWEHDDALEVFTLRRGRPLQWQTWPAEPADAALALRAGSLPSGAPRIVEGRGLAPEITAAIAAVPGVTFRHGDAPTLDRAARIAAERILSGRAAPPVDLRSASAFAGESAAMRAVRPTLAATLVACAVAFACVAVALGNQSRRYAAAADRYEDQKREAFHRAFPGQPVPAGVASRLLSAEAGLLHGRPNTTARPGGSALGVLRDVAAAIPSDLHLRVDELEIDGRKISLRGTVPDYAGVDALAGALRRAGMAVDDPQAQQRSEPGGGVDVAIVASAQASAPIVTRHEPLAGSDAASRVVTAPMGANAARAEAASANLRGTP